MKLKINPYLKSLLKENIIYIIINGLLLVIIISFLIYNYNSLPEKENKILTLEQEINALNNKVKLLTSPLASNKEEIEYDIKLLESLIPNVEDYFSIIYALEQLSIKTGFIVNSYTINLSQSNTSKFQLLISGVGDKEAFTKFLNNYNFAGGRLITADKIEYYPQYSGAIKLTIYFYTKKIAPDDNQNINLNSNMLTEIAKLRSKVNFDIKQSTEDASLFYEKKSNPF